MKCGAGVSGDEGREDGGDVWWGLCHGRFEVSGFVEVVEGALESFDASFLDKMRERVGVICFGASIEEGRSKEAEESKEAEGGGAPRDEGVGKGGWEFKCWRTGEF